MTRFHNLFFALRPPLDIANRIMDLRRQEGLSGQWLQRERLHVSVLSLGRHPVMPLRLIDGVSELLDGRQLPQCAMMFDQLVNGKRSAFLGSRASLPDVERLQTQLYGFLRQGGIPVEPSRSRPHVTLGYNVTPQPVQDIHPLGWTATELVLIDSLYGEGKHLTMARWPLGDGNACGEDRPVPRISAGNDGEEQQLSLFV